MHPSVKPPGSAQQGHQGEGKVFLGANKTWAPLPGRHRDTHERHCSGDGPRPSPSPGATQPALLHCADVLKPFNSFQMCQKADTCSLVFTLCFTLVSAFQ